MRIAPSGAEASALAVIRTILLGADFSPFGPNACIWYSYVMPMVTSRSRKMLGTDVNDPFCPRCSVAISSPYLVIRWIKWISSAQHLGTVLFSAIVGIRIARVRTIQKLIPIDQSISIVIALRADLLELLPKVELPSVWQTIISSQCEFLRPRDWSTLRDGNIPPSRYSMIS